MPHRIMEHMRRLEVSPFHSISEVAVEIETNPKSQEIYKVGGRYEGNQWVDLYALAKVALDRLMSAAGMVTTHAETTLRQERVWYSEFECDYTQPDGKVVHPKDDKEIDLRVGGTRWTDRRQTELDWLLKELGVERGIFKKDRNRYLKQEGGTVRDEDIIDLTITLEDEDPSTLDRLGRVADHKATRFVNQQAKFGSELASTGARERAIRAQMQIRVYTLKELEEPFIVLRTEYDRDAMRRILGQKMYERIMAGIAATNLGLPEGLAQGIISAPEGVSEELVELGEEAAGLREMDADKASAMLNGDPIPVPDIPVEVEGEVVEPPKEEDPFSLVIADEMEAWLKVYRERGGFKGEKDLLAFFFPDVEIESLWRLKHGEALNIQRFIKLVYELPDEEKAQAKAHFRDIVIRCNAEKRLWVEEGEATQLPLEETSDGTDNTNDS